MRIIHKALGISLLVHLAVLVFLLVLPLLVSKKHYAPIYQISLVSQPEPKPREPVLETPRPKPPPKKPAKVEKKPSPPVRKETKREKKKAEKKEVKKTVSKRSTKAIKKKAPKRENSIQRVEQKIEEIRRKQVAQRITAEDRRNALRIIEAKRNAYFDAVAARIQANWSLLKNQMEDVGVLTTDLGVQIRSDGAITKIVVEKPSGNPLFDEFAIRAVKRSDPLPPFPKELSETKLEVTIGLSS